jgi:hypothetical protein
MLDAQVRLLIPLRGYLPAFREQFRTAVELPVRRKERSAVVVIDDATFPKNPPNAICALWAVHTWSLEDDVARALCGGSDIDPDHSDPAIVDVYKRLYSESVWAVNLATTALRTFGRCESIGEIPTGEEYIGNFYASVLRATATVDGTTDALTRPRFLVFVEGRFAVSPETIEAAVPHLARGRVPLPLELIANAERHHAQGHYRAAIVEVASALEALLSDFGQHADLSRLNADRVARIPMSFSKIVSEIGMRGTVRLLLPLLLSEDIVDDWVLSTTVEAIELRNEVVHQGKRELDRDAVRDAIAAIRELARRLPSNRHGGAVTASGDR